MRPDPVSEFRAGLLLILPAALAVVPFALLLGAAAAQKGLTPLETGLMGAMVFAGGSQFVAVDLWTDPAPWLALGSAALLVNLRFVLMTASIAGKLKGFSPLGRAFVVFFMADENWAMAERRAAQAPLTVPFLFGLTAIFYLNWLVWTVLGAWIGSAFENPERLGFDFAFTAIFIGLAIGFWKGPSTGIVMAVSGIAAALTYLAVDGPWYVMTGAIAGMAVAFSLPLRERADSHEVRAERGGAE